MLWRGITAGPTSVDQHSKQGGTTPVYQGYILNIDPRLNH